MDEIVVRVKLLSEVGLEARDTLGGLKHLPTVRRILEKLDEFLKRVEMANRPQLLIIVGDWGEGKTAIYQAFLAPLENITAKRVLASDIIHVFEKLVEKLPPKEAFIASLFLVLTGIDPKNAKLRSYDDVARLASRAYLEVSQGKPLIIFIDEFETIASLFDDVKRRHLIGATLEALTGFVNNDIGVLRELSLDKRIHLVIAVTKAADHLLRSRGETSSIWPRLTRRALRLELRRMSRIEAIEAFKHLLSVVLEKRVELKQLFSPPSLVNMFIEASMGLPAALERVVNTLAVKVFSKGLGLDVNKAVDIMDVLEVSIEGVLEKVLIREEYEALEEKCVEALSQHLPDATEARLACRVTLLSLAGVSHKLLKDTLDLIVLEGFGFRVKGFRVKADVHRLIAVFTRVVEEIRLSSVKAQAVFSKTGLDRLKPLELFEKLLDPLIHVCDDGATCLLLPEEGRLAEYYSELLGVEDNYAKALAGIVYEIIAKLAKENAIEETEDEYIEVPSQIKSRYVLTHELALLDFIPREQRLEVWRRVRRFTQKHLTIGFAPIALALLKRFTNLQHLQIDVVKVSEDVEAIKIVLAGEKLYTTLKMGERRSIKLPSPSTLKALVIGVRNTSELETVREWVERQKFSQRPHVVIVVAPAAVNVARVKQLFEDMLLTAYIPIELRHSDLVRVASLGVYAELLGVDTVETYVSEISRLLLGQRVGRSLYGLDNLRLLEALTRTLSDIDMTLLLRELEESLVKVGVLLPSHFEANVCGEKLAVQNMEHAVLALRWVIHYPTKLVDVPVKHIYDYVEENVRRYMLYGRKYREVIGVDIESCKELVKNLAALQSLRILDVKCEDNVPRVTLELMKSPYARRLLAALNNQELPLTELPSLYFEPESSSSLATLLEALITLGVVKVEQREERKLVIKRIEPWLKLNEVKQALSNLRKKLEKLCKLGYIIVGKERGFRVSSTCKLIDDLCERLKHVEKLLNIGDDIEALRLLASIERMLNEVLGVGYQPARTLKRHLDIVACTDEVFRKVRSVLSKTLDRLEELTKKLENLLNTYIVEGKVELKHTLVDKIRKFASYMLDLEEHVMDENELKDLAARLWLEYGNDKFPFQFRQGDIYCFNPKVYMLFDKARNENLLSIDERSGEIRLSDEVSKEVSWLETMVERVKRCIEERRESLEKLRKVTELVSSNKLLKKVAPRLTKLLSETPPLNLARVKVERSVLDLYSDEGKYEVQRAIDEFSKEARIEQLYDTLSEMLDKASDIESMIVSLKGLEDEVRNSLLRLTEIVKSYELPPQPLKELEKSIEALNETLVELSKLESMFSILKKRVNVGSLGVEGINEILDVFNEVYNGLLDVRARAEKRVNDALVSLKLAVHMVCREVEKRLTRLSKWAGIAAKLGLNELQSRLESAKKLVLDATTLKREELPYYVEALAKLLNAMKLVDDSQLREQLASRLSTKFGLDNEEIEVLRVVVEAGGSIDVNEIRAKTGMEVEKLIRVLVKLVEKGWLKLHAVCA